MTLLALLDELDEAIGSGTNAATLRHRLSLIREQAEAIESQMEAAQLRVQELKVQLQQPHAPPQQTAFEEAAEKMLDQFFEAGKAFPIERVAESLQLGRSMADYHVDTLVSAQMLEMCAYHPGRGTLYILTPKGRAHVVARRKT